MIDAFVSTKVLFDWITIFIAFSNVLRAGLKTVAWSEGVQTVIAKSEGKVLQ